MASSTDKVEGFEHIRMPKVISRPKEDIKNLFLLMMREVFEHSRSRSFKLSDSTSKDDTKGLQVLGRFPRVRKELPAVSVTISDLTLSRMGVNSNLPTDVVNGINADFLDNSGSGYRAGYYANGLLNLSVSAASDHQRDELVDIMFDFLGWNENEANIDVSEYLNNRGFHIIDAEFRMAGDGELPLDERGDLMYTDTLVLPFHGEIYSDLDRATRLQGLDWEAEVVDQT